VEGGRRDKQTIRRARLVVLISRFGNDVRCKRNNLEFVAVFFVESEKPPQTADPLPCSNAIFSSFICSAFEKGAGYGLAELEDREV
jgi:hypothetical protein